MNDSSFGKTVYILGVSIEGEVDLDQWKRFLPTLCVMAGVCASHEGVAFDYPLENDVYIGYIHVQPISTSFIALDVWPNHNGAYLHICSCKPFHATDLLHLLSTRYQVGNHFQTELGL